jgi:RNA polymerase sigma-70 factor (ECF subfamily)
MNLSIDYATYDDERLMSLIAQLRQEALAQLYERYSRMIFSLTLAILNDRATAEEVTLDVFMRVWQKADSYRVEQARVSTWLAHIARNRAIDVLRRGALRPDRSAVHWEAVRFGTNASEGDLQESVESALRREQVHLALSQLPREQQQVLILAYFGGYTQRQIAETLKQPLGTVKTRLRLAMQKLREILADEQNLREKSTSPKNA